ncbi:transposase [Lysinibacillus sp. NPDC093190]|uniref:transposase n=1 Tax=Lysinibacillus sp. NPDC093190 TaxID=3390575 RepID=UPI003D076321
MSRTNKVYSTEFKVKVVRAYLNGEGSYRTLANQYGIRSSTQLKQWVKIFQEAGSTETFERISAGAKGVKNHLKGKRIHFKSVEEESDYFSSLSLN